MNKRSILLMFISCCLASSSLVAQFSLRAGASAGPARVAEYDDDGSGWNHGIELALGYDLGGRWGTLLLSVSRESFSGFHVVRDFSQPVPRFDPIQGSTAVSLAVHQRGFRAYRLMLGAEDVLYKPWPRLKLGVLVGMMFLDNGSQLIYEVIEQDAPNSIVAPNFEYRFQVDDGTIRRIPLSDLYDRNLSVLNRYRFAISQYLTYQLTEEVQLMLSWDYTLGPLGKRYGKNRDRNMLGDLSYMRIGVIGRLFTSSPSL